MTPDPRDRTPLQDAKEQHARECDREDRIAARRDDGSAQQQETETRELDDAAIEAAWTGERGEVMARALVDIHEEVEALADEIRPDYDELVAAVDAVERLSREGLPKGTLEGWGEEAHDG